MGENITRDNNYRIFIVWSSIIAVALMFAIFVPETDLHDFSIYWKATNNFLLGKDPYSLPHQFDYFVAPSHIHEPKQVPILKVWGPPVVFATTLPFGLLPLALAKKFYLFTLLATILGSAAFFWNLYLKSYLGSKSLFTGVIIFVHLLPFGTFLHSFLCGSVSFFLLLGITLTLWLLSKHHFFLAGFSFYIWTFKPQILWLPAVYIIAWALRTRNYQLLSGIFCGGLCAVTLVTIFNSESWKYYSNAHDMAIPFRIETSTLPSIVYALTGCHYRGILFLPALLISIAIVGWNRIYNVSPLIIVPLLLPFTALLGPYAWGHDYLICVPLYYLAFSYFYIDPKSQETRFVTITLYSHLVIHLLLALTFNHFFWSVNVIPGIFLALCANTLAESNLLQTKLFQTNFKDESKIE